MSSETELNKSTVYVSNLPFSLTNADIYKIFSMCGRIRKVTILKCPQRRKSKGVAFVQFFSEDDAIKCVHVMNKKEVGGRIINCNIARDNGRGAEFMNKKSSTFKDICFECGDSGHISYECPKNVLGGWKPSHKPEKEFKKKKTTKHKQQSVTTQENVDSDQEVDCETLSYAIKRQQEVVYGASTCPGPSELKSTRKVYKRSAYFSDEEFVSD